jgi:hypothetical protein
LSSRTKIATSAVAEHSLQVRGSQRTNGWQWKTVRLLHPQRILQKLGRSSEIFISLSPAVQGGSWNADSLKRYYPLKSQLHLDVIYSSFSIFVSLYSKN